MNKLTRLFNGRMPKMVMFDLDGTLVDSVPDIAVAANGMLADLQKPQVEESLVRTWVGNGAAKLVERALINAGFAIDEVIDPAFHHAQLDRFKTHYGQHSSVNTYLYDGVLAFLQALSANSVEMTVVTNKPREFVPNILRSLNIDKYFSHIIGGNDLPQRKPAPEPLLHCMKICECTQSDDVLMVGDSRNDIEAAKNAGIPVVAVNYGYNQGRPVETDQPTLVVSSLVELIP